MQVYFACTSLQGRQEQEDEGQKNPKELVSQTFPAHSQQGQRRHPQSLAVNDVSMHSNIFFKALVLPDSKCQLLKHHLGKQTIP